MTYQSKLAATLSMTGLSPAMRALHVVVRATVAGKPVGWTVVMKPVPVR